MPRPDKTLIAVLLLRTNIDRVLRGHGLHGAPPETTIREHLMRTCTGWTWWFLYVHPHLIKASVVARKAMAPTTRATSNWTSTRIVSMTSAPRTAKLL